MKDKITITLDVEQAKAIDMIFRFDCDYVIKLFTGSPYVIKESMGISSLCELVRKEVRPFLYPENKDNV